MGMKWTSKEQKDYRLAKIEVESLAMSMWKRFYRDESPTFELCDSVAGIMTQIDNMVTGLEKDDGLFYTKERPTKSGWYWIKQHGIELVAPGSVEVEQEGTTWVEFPGDHTSYEIDFSISEEEAEDKYDTIGGKNIEWYGPIKVPK